MTPPEFDVFRRRAIMEYAAEHVRAADWSPDRAEQLAEKETDDLLPNGVDTPGMLLLVAENNSAEVIGLVWVALERQEGPGAWIYDIEIVPEQRGRGYGRALLEAAEREVKRRGVQSLGLNVFGGNLVARGLYESSGYEITSIQMRKSLGS
jgi:ribosomal protein S18 acetylase RimI-like enzyme